MPGQLHPILHPTIVGHILNDNGSRKFLTRSVDNVKTKIRSTAESLLSTIFPEEDEVLRQIFIDSEGVDIDLRSIQFDRMKKDINWKDNISCVPYTIFLKIMMSIGFCGQHDPDICLSTEFTANTECAVLASLIWR